MSTSDIVPDSVEENAESEREIPEVTDDSEEAINQVVVEEESLKEEEEVAGEEISTCI